MRGGWGFAGVLTGVVACSTTEVAPDAPCGEAEVRGPDGRCRSTVEDTCLFPRELVAGACVGRRCPAGSWERGDGVCQPAGISPDRACPPGEIEQANGCRPAGVPEDACREGFVHDGDGGCVPTLPAERCGEGMLAVPGDSTCRPVGRACGTGTWGDIPVEADTQYVDGAFVGVSDGTPAAPWTTIVEAVSAASSGAMIAIAAGAYYEEVRVQQKPVRLYGRCPSMVEIVAPSDMGAPAFAILITEAVAAGSEVHDVKLSAEDRQSGTGLAVGNTSGIVAEGVHVTDAYIGLFSSGLYGPGELIVRDSLIEDCVTNAGAWGSRLVFERSASRFSQNAGLGTLYSERLAEVMVTQSVFEDNFTVGIACYGCEGTVEGSVIRGNLPPDDEEGGHGILVSHDVFGPLRARPALTVRGCVVESNQTGGIIAQGGDALIEDTVVRDTRAYTDPAAGPGHGIHVIPMTIFPDWIAANVVVRSSLVDANVAAGIEVASSTLMLDGVWVRDTQPIGTGENAGNLGVGLLALAQSGSPLTTEVSVFDSRFEENHNGGILSIDGAMHVEGTLVRATKEDVQGAGYGIFASTRNKPGSPLFVGDTEIDDSHGAGIMLWGVDAVIEASLIRGTRESSLGSGSAIMVKYAETSKQVGSVAEIRGVLIEGNDDASLSIFGSTVNLVGSLIRDTRANLDGAYGDGVQLVSTAKQRAVASLVDVRIEDSARAALSVFGGDLDFTGVELVCQSFGVNAEVTEGEPLVSDGGFSACGCPTAESACLVETSGLDPIGPIDESPPD